MNAELTEKPLYPFFLFDCKLSEKEHLRRVLDAMGMCEQERRHVQSRWKYIHRCCDKRSQCLVRLHQEGVVQFISPRQSAAARELSRLMSVYASMPESFRCTSHDTTAMLQEQANHTKCEWNQRFQTLNSIAEDEPHIELLESTTNALKMYDTPSQESWEDMERVEREWRQERCEDGIR